MSILDKLFKLAKINPEPPARDETHVHDIVPIVCDKVMELPWSEVHKIQLHRTWLSLSTKGTNAERALLLSARKKAEALDREEPYKIALKDIVSGSYTQQARPSIMPISGSPAINASMMGTQLTSGKFYAGGLGGGGMTGQVGSNQHNPFDINSKP